MKKFSLLLIAAVVAMSASAGISFKGTHSLKSKRVINTEMTKLQGKALKNKANNLRVINEQPAGELKSYNRSGQGVYASGGYLYCSQQDGSRMDIVWGEDGKVYLKDILFNFGAGTWVEGEIFDGIYIKVPLNQSIYWSEDYQADINLCWGRSYLTEDNKIGFERIEKDEILYAIDEEAGTITLLDTEGPSELDSSDPNSYCGLGLSAYWTDDDSWYGNVEWNTMLTEREIVPAPTVITEIPEGCEVYTYYRNSSYIANSAFFGVFNGNTDGKINVAFGQDGKVYIQNPIWWHDGYNTWVEGTYDWMTGIITIPTGQYLSWNADYEYGIQLVWGSTYTFEDGVDEDGNPAYSISYEIDDRTTEIQFQIDDDCFYLLGSEGDINAEFPLNYNATGLMSIYSDDQSMTALEFANRDENGYAEPMGYIVNAVPAVPANPTADEWYDCGNEGGYSRFYFTLPTTDVDGNMIDPEYLSVSIYTDDDQIFTFDANTYDYDLTEDMTEIPYWIFSSGYDFHTGYFYFYRTNADGYDQFFNHQIGVQVHYTVNGVKNSSDIVYLEVFPGSNVNEINTGKTVAGVRYYNVAGQEMAQPSGMTIQVTTYTDGTTSAAKVVK